MAPPGLGLLLRRSQPFCDLCHNGIGPCRNLLGRLVLNGMFNVNSIKLCAAQSTGLNARRADELRSRNRHRRDAQILKPDGVVQTARCARPSIRQPFHHGIQPAQLLDHLLGRIFGVGRFFGADHFGYAVLRSQQFFEPIKENASAGLADIEQADFLALQRCKAHWRRSGLRPCFVSGMNKHYRHDCTFIFQEWDM